MAAAVERLFGRVALTASPARVAEAAAEIGVPVPAARRLVPLARRAAANWLGQGRGSEEQREGGNRAGKSRAGSEIHSAAGTTSPPEHLYLQFRRAEDRVKPECLGQPDGWAVVKTAN